MSRCARSSSDGTPAGLDLGVRRGGARHRAGRGRTLRPPPSSSTRRRTRPTTRRRSTSTTASPPTTWPRSSPPVGASARQQNEPGAAAEESAIFQRMAVQGQTMVAASGDSGSEDCFAGDLGTELAVDDPGSQPDVLSGGGTTLVGGAAASQTRLEQLRRPVPGPVPGELGERGRRRRATPSVWPRPAWQPATVARDGRPRPPQRARPLAERRSPARCGRLLRRLGAVRRDQRGAPVPRRVPGRHRIRAATAPRSGRPRALRRRRRRRRRRLQPR